MSQDKFQILFNQSVLLKQLCIKNGFDSLVTMGNEIANSIFNGGKLMFCGNGGSAADAQHLAADLVVRLRPNYNRN